MKEQDTAGQPYGCAAESWWWCQLRGTSCCALSRASLCRRDLFLVPAEQPEPLPRQVRAQIQALGSPAGKVLGSDALGDFGLSHSSVLAIQHALVKPAVQG